jgi:uncharacterized membrane protein YhhN
MLAITALQWTVGIIIWFVAIIAAVGIAMNKGRSGIGWGLLAAILPVIALIIVALLPPKTAGTQT